MGLRAFAKEAYAKIVGAFLTNATYYCNYAFTTRPFQRVKRFTLDTNKQLSQPVDSCQRQVTPYK